MNEQDIDPRMLALFEFRARKGDFKKLEIIQAAIDCLAELGLENTTYEALALKLGTRRAHIAYHFSDKNQIFLSAVKYILGTYQQTVVDALSKVSGQNSARPLLQAYIKAVFAWAKQNPSQLQCMLLLYYLTTIQNEYLELHNEVRAGGVERLAYLYGLEFKDKLTSAELKLQAKSLQNLLSGSLMDAVTTQSTTLSQAESNTLKFLDFQWQFLNVCKN